LFALNKLQFIEIKPLLFLGKISYLLYLLHEVIGLIILKYLDGVSSFKMFNTVCTIFIVILFSWFTSKYIEVPGSRFFKMFLSSILRKEKYEKQSIDIF
jgi:peptidoglycan/LPS O-acetylase OafA/YrhL